MGTTDEHGPEEAQQENTQQESERIHFLQLNSSLLYNTGIKKLFSTPGGDTLLRIYIEAHCAALQTGGVMEIPEWNEAAQYIIDKTTLPEQALDMARTAIRYMLRYELIDCTRRDGTAVKLTSADIKDINVDDIARIEFLLTPEYTRSWAKDTLDRKEKQEKKKKEREEAEKAEKLAKADADRILESWGKTGLPEVVRMTDKRRRHIAARVRSFKIDKVLAAIEMAGQSSFLKSSPWATFDWVVENDDHMARILEGKYADRQQPQQYDAQAQAQPSKEIITDKTVQDVIKEQGLFVYGSGYDLDQWEKVKGRYSAAMQAAIEQAIKQ